MPQSLIRVEDKVIWAIKLYDRGNYQMRTLFFWLAIIFSAIAVVVIIEQSTSLLVRLLLLVVAGAFGELSYTNRKKK
jgi:hypothetical protein